MMRKLREVLLRRDVGWRILSLVLAFFLWFVCITFIDPEKDGKFTVMLELRNEDALGKNKKVLQNAQDLKSRQITIDVRGTTKTIDALTDASFTAYVDLNKAEILNATQIGEYLMASVIVPDIDADVKIIRQNPQEVGILLDEIIQKQIPVKVMDVGIVRDGYVVAPVKAVSDVRISGARTTLSTITHMEIEVNVNNAASDVTVTATPIAYDENGNEVTGFQFVSSSLINVTVPIHKKGIVTILTPRTTGALPEGFDFAGTPEWTPKEIEVSGPEAIVDQNKALSLQEIDVTGRRQSFTESIDLRAAIDKSLTIISQDEQFVDVTILIEPKISKTFVVPVTNIAIIGMPPGASIITEAVEVTVYGRASLVESIESMTGTVNLSGEETEGEYELLVKWTLPRGLTDTGEPAHVRILLSLPDDSDVTEGPEDEPPADE